MELPKEFFTIGTFSTLTGSALIVTLVTGIIAYLFNSDSVHLKKWLSFGLSFAVAFVGVLLLQDRPATVWVLGFLNAFLIFATAAGGNVILAGKQPPPGAPPAPGAGKTHTGIGTQLFRARWF
ncbi:MAG: hypothetical protein HYX81_04775 [Chloroflexi bacterium]|nr:hypothetical protein [Chloroflexota bacterium]